MDHSTQGLPFRHQLSELTQTHVHRVSDAIQPSHPLCLSPSPAFSLSIFIRVFSNESALQMRWPKYWSFSVSISPFNEHPGLVSFRMDWLDLLAVQGTRKSLLQHHVYNFDRYSKYKFFDALTVPISPKSYEYSTLSNFWGLIDEKLIKDRFLKLSLL